jgi:uncharacterized membrane protein YfcA
MDQLHAIDPLYALSGFFVGLLVGQTGMGGGSLTTAIWCCCSASIRPRRVGTDLLYASVTKTADTMVHGLNKTVDWRIVRRLVSGSVPATLVTLAVISRYDISGPTSTRIISSVLGVMLLLTALSLVFRRQFLALWGTLLHGMPPQRVARLTTLTGVILGVLVTVSSVGAGALGVTALLLYPEVPMAVIVGYAFIGCTAYPACRHTEKTTAPKSAA